MPPVEVTLTDREERAAWIHFQLKRVGSSFAELADELGVTRQTVQTVLDRPYPKIERAIAEKIGIAAEEIWPDRWKRRARRQRRAMRGAA